MKAEELKQKFEEAGYEVWLKEREEGIRVKTKRVSVWIKVDRDALRDAVEHFIEVSDVYPHFSIISASDEGDNVELNYHFTMGFGKLHEEYSVNFKEAMVTISLCAPMDAKGEPEAKPPATIARAGIMNM